MSPPVHILGGYQTDFARNWTKEADDPLYAMLEQAVSGCLAAAGVEPEEIETAHVGNFMAERICGQSHLGAMLTMIDPAWRRLPAARHEAACASGSVALLAAMAEIEAGRYDVALVAGVELLRALPGAQTARHMGAAAWVGHETCAEVLPWPSLFDAIADETERRYGLDRAYLRRITEINRSNARRNPLAQARGWTDERAAVTDDDTVNPVVAGRTRRSDCGLITDGACAVVLAGPCFTETWRRRGGTASVIQGWGHHTAPLPLAAKFELSKGEEYLFPNVRAAITDAYRRAGLAGPGDLDVVETHDCFTITEYVAIEHFGLTVPGRAWEAIEDGRIEPGGSLPVNASGGLIGAGHPVGATGVRMLLDAHRQVTGTAGDYQVPGARTAATLNIGGSASTAVGFVVGQAG